MTTDARLPSGITVGEAIRRAQVWWAEFRGMVPRKFTEINERRGRVSRTKNSGLLMQVMESYNDPQVNSGILRGDPWEKLTAKEQRRIVTCWHDYVLLEGHNDGRVMIDPDSVPMVNGR